MQVSDKVLRVLKAEQISDEELALMLRHAAISSLRGSSRRYHLWLFWLVGDCLVDMQHADLVEVGRGESRVLEEHEVCNGQGCRACGWVGEISRGVRDVTEEVLSNCN